MSKLSIRRVGFNFLLICLSVISIALIVFLSWRGYPARQIPEVYTKKQMAEQIIKDYSAEGFTENDIKNINIEKGEDNRSFSASADIVKETETCRTTYNVYYSYHVSDGRWTQDKGSGELISQPTEWLLPGTTWTATLADGSEYCVVFSTITDANVSITEPGSGTEDDTDASNYEEDEEEPEPNETFPADGNTWEESDMDEEPAADENTGDENVLNEDSSEEEIDGMNLYEDSTNEGITGMENDLNESFPDEEEEQKNGMSGGLSDEEESSEFLMKNQYCQLSLDENNSSYSGIIQREDGTVIVLTVTTDAVKLNLGNDKGEIILEKV